MHHSVEFELSTVSKRVFADFKTGRIVRADMHLRKIVLLTLWRVDELGHR